MNMEAKGFPELPEGSAALLTLTLSIAEYIRIPDLENYEINRCSLKPQDSW